MTAAGLQLSEHEARLLSANIWKYYLYSFLVSFMLVAPIWVIYLIDERGLNTLAVSSLEAFGGTVIALAEVPTGVVADRYGRRTSMVIGGSMVSLGVLLFAIARGYPLLLLMYLIWHIGITFRSGADAALLYDSLKAVGRAEEFQKVFGRVQSITQVALFGALIVGSVLAGIAGSATVPILVGAVTMVLSTLVTATMHEAPFREEHGHLGYGQILGQSTRLLARLPALRWSLLLAAVIGVVAWIPTIYAQVFLKERVPTLAVGLFLATNVAFAVISSLMAHRLCARFGTRALVLVACATIVVAYALLAAVDSLWLYPMFVVCSFMVAVFRVPIGDYINRRIPSAQRATVLSAGSLIACLMIAAVGPPLGFLSDEASIQATFAAVSVGFGVVAALNIFLWLRADQAEGRSAAAEAQAPVAS